MSKNHDISLAACDKANRLFDEDMDRANRLPKSVNTIFKGFGAGLLATLISLQLPHHAIAATLDTDNDGINDSVDLDDDNDGIPDLSEVTCHAGTEANKDSNWDSAATTGDLMASINLVTGVQGTATTNANFLAGGYPTYSGSPTELNYARNGSANSASNGNELVYWFNTPIINHTLRISDLGADGSFNESMQVDFYYKGSLVTISPSSMSNGGSFSAGIASGVNSGANPQAGYVFDLTRPVDEIRIKQVDTSGNGLGEDFVGIHLSKGGCAAWDFDADGVPDMLDLDSDNDGITDTIEAGGTDANSNGIIDGFSDSNGDGLNDATAASPLPINDFDSDGNRDFLDVDSDNDGLTDLSEAGGTDVNGDGVIDVFVDMNNDGLDDATANSPLPVWNTDSDASPDHLDLDADNDGLTDIYEAGGVDSNNDGVVDNYTDNDFDGLDDAIKASPLPDGDFDADGKPDHQDTDSDNDTIPDAIEASNGPVDTDADGQMNHLDVDSDNDTIPDAVESGGSPLNPVDTDLNGDPDYLDTDSDNDGIADNVEAGSNPSSPADANGNNVPDYLEPPNGGPQNPQPPVQPPTDTDGDGIPDSVEGTGDTDGDSIPDYQDIDSDNDGLLDSDETVVDTDNDGVPNYLDLDSDNDGLTGTFEAGGDDVDANGIVDNFTDINGDGWDDGVAANPLPDGDFDGDGIVDHLDLDSDNDGLADIAESNAAGNDANGDGRIDSPVDSNSDGLADGITVNGIIDTDTDGNSNHLDLDSDNDGISDLVAAGGTDANGDGQVDGWSDHDSDGIPDNVDFDLTGGNDADGDGIADFADADTVGLVDSDGDGIVDDHDANPFGDGFIPVGSTTAPTTTNNIGQVYTGLQAGGCSIHTRGGLLDPLLPMFALMSLLALSRRRPAKSKV